MARGRHGKRALGRRVNSALIAFGLQSNIMAQAQSAPVVTFSGPPSCADQVLMAALTFGLPEPLIVAVLQVESAGRSHAVSRAGAMGCMQLMPGTWAEMRARLVLGDDPFDVRDNMLAGTAYLRDLHDRYGWPGALAAYNAGPRRYELYRSAGVRLPSETRAYLARLGVFRPDMGGADAFPTMAEKHVDWTQAPLFVVHADVHSASRTTPIKRNEVAVEPHEIGGDDVARTTPGMFVGSRMEAAGAPSNGIFVGATR